MIAGGANEVGELNDVETIDMWELPSLDADDTREGASLDIIGETVYLCGGNKNKGDAFDTCYTINPNDTSPEWKRNKTFNEAMSYHTSTVVGLEIWFMHDSKMYVLDTVTEATKTYKLPFESSTHHCAVGNSTHSFQVGVGPDRLEVWVNKYPKDPSKWMKVATLSQSKTDIGCLLFNGVIFVTGGCSGNGTDDLLDHDTVFDTVETIDTNFLNSTTTQNLNIGRCGHRMMVLDNQIAVGGGVSKSTGVLKPTDSIEVYDMDIGVWIEYEQSLEFGKYGYGIAQYH